MRLHNLRTNPSIYRSLCQTQMQDLIDAEPFTD